MEWSMPGSAMMEYLACAVVILVLSFIYASVAAKRDRERRPPSSRPNKSDESMAKGERKSSAPQQSTKVSKKKPQQVDKWRPDSKHSYSHGWLLTSLKGHTSPVIDLDFSPNGKYLASCAEDDGGGTSGSSSGSEGNKENRSPTGSRALSRRQKKNSRGRHGSPPVQPKKGAGAALRQRAKLDLTEGELYRRMQSYRLSPKDLFEHGYPTESRLYPGRAVVFKYEARPFNPHAREFHPGDSVYPALIQNDPDAFHRRKAPPVDSTAPGLSQEKKCARCSKTFFMADGEYLTQERCLYHWGKLCKAPGDVGPEPTYTCCRGKKFSKGCATGKLHVWSGLAPGRNGPFEGYVRTRPRKNEPPDGNYGIYALDCEMCYTTLGMELTRITVVACDGRLVYDSYVRPESEVIDYNTRFSGVTAKDLSGKAGAKTLREVQNDLMGFVRAETVLVGHGLENDLRALRLVHTSVVDTAVVFPHFLGLPYRRSLKSLVSSVLRRDIQAAPAGHCSFEDARAALELILWKLRKDSHSHRPHDL